MFEKGMGVETTDETSEDPQSLIEELNRSRESFSSMSTAFSGAWLELVKNPETREELRPYVEDRWVIDLGGGSLQGLRNEGLDAPPMQTVAEELNAGFYTIVDRHLMPGDHPLEWSSDYSNDPLVKRVVSSRGNVPTVYTHADMLDFVSSLTERIRESSIPPTIALNGIDEEDIITDGRYHVLLAKEIAKALPEGGVVLTRGSSAREYFEEEGLFLQDELVRGAEVWVKGASTAA